VQGDSAPVRVAIIDDHELVREGLRALVDRESAGHIVPCYVGEDVTAALAEEPSVVLLDIDLGPSRPGVVENVGQCVLADVPVLLISAFDQAEPIRAALTAGALGFVPKRVAFAELQDALTTAARRELYLSVDLAALLAAARDRPDLSPRELQALQLYASGLKMAAVAHRMGVSPYTAKEYLDRVRSKYQHVGRPARTRTELYAEATRDGLLTDGRDQPGS
jgi:DNA-binding NarL/FixJ family response regulator